MDYDALNKIYSFGFKLHVVELYLSSEVSYQELALSQGIKNHALLTKWVNDFKISWAEVLRSQKKGRKKSLDTKNVVQSVNETSVDTSAEHIKQTTD